MDSRLKTARLAHDLSQSQLAKAAGINLQMLQHYEQGVRDLSGAKLATLLKLCRALQCSLEDILPDKPCICGVPRPHNRPQRQ